jgi:hypothetical protein
MHLYKRAVSRQRSRSPFHMYIQDARGHARQHGDYNSQTPGRLRASGVIDERYPASCARLTWRRFQRCLTMDKVVRLCFARAEQDRRLISTEISQRCSRIWGSVTREPHGGRTGPPFRLGYGRVCDRRAGGAPFHFGRAEKLRHPDHTWTFVKKECYDNRRLADLANRRLQRLGENDSGLMVRMLDTAIEDPAHPSACREICRGPVRSRDTTAAAAWYACGRCWME